MAKRRTEKFFTLKYFMVACVLIAGLLSLLVYYKISRDQTLLNYNPEELRSIPVSTIKERIKHSPETSYNKIYDNSSKIPRMEPPIDWSYNFTKNRSDNFYLHSWDMINSDILDYDKTRDVNKLKSSMVVALDWVRNNPVSYKNNQDKSFAWYDMAVGVRLYRLAYIFDQAVRQDLGTDDEYRLLWNSLVDHIIYLKDDNNIIFHNNHGLYQAAGQKAMARRLAPISDMFNVIQKQADNRLVKMLKQQFTSEGVHKEHSPDYHRMVYQTFLILQREGLLSDVADKILAKAGDALFWMIKPDGTLTNFGDSDYRKIPKETSEYGNGSEMLLYYLADGKKGVSQKSNLEIFQNSGFGVVKTKQSYLAQEASFFSRTHKHADDLTFNWYEGQDILIDSGKYGYKGKTDPKSDDAKAGFWYADKRRQYVEKTRAHNTVEIDGKDFLRRGRKPFGSAIVDSGETKNGVYFMRSAVDEFSTIRFERLLIYKPGEWLVVLDDLNDSSDLRHSYKQWFQFAPNLDVVKSDNELLVRNVGKTALRAVSLLNGPKTETLIRGQKKPSLQGWYSRNADSFIPTTSASFSQNGNDAQFLTLFVFSDKAPQTDRDNNTLNHFSWISSGKHHTIDVDRLKSVTNLEYNLK